MATLVAATSPAQSPLEERPGRARSFQPAGVPLAFPASADDPSFALPGFGGATDPLQTVRPQIFDWICHMTVGIRSAIDPGACLWNVFQGRPLRPARVQVPFEEFVSVLSAGDRDNRLRSVVDVLLSNTSQDLINRVSALPLSPLNGDTGDGPISITNPALNQPNQHATAHTVIFRGAEVVTNCTVSVQGSVGAPVESNAGPVFVESLRSAFPQFYDRLTRPGICAQFLFHRDPGDTLSLDSTLSHSQEALLGCGPLFGTRCDSGTLIETLPDGIAIDAATEDEALQNLEDAITTLHPRGGGIDLAKTEATSLLQSWPGIVGATADDGIFWTTFGRVRQPGPVSIDDPLAFQDGGHEVREFGPACTRLDQDGDPVTLPGCRGIEMIFLTRDPHTNAVTGIEIAFENDYEPGLDGCVIGGGLNRRTADAIANIGGVDVFLRPNARGYMPDPNALEECHTTSFSRNGDFRTESTSISGSSWLWHPAAGCLSPDRAQDVRRFGSNNIDFQTGESFADCGLIENADGIGVNRTMVDRFADLNLNGFADIEDEFVNHLTRLDGVSVTMSQIFRSEMAAVSYNFLNLLVITSCSQQNESQEDIELRPECFDPANPLRADKCSFNAPQLCANLRGFRRLGSAQPLAIDQMKRREKKGRVRIKVQGHFAANELPLDGEGSVAVLLGGLSEVVGLEEFGRHGGVLKWKGRRGGLRKILLREDGRFRISLKVSTEKAPDDTLPFLLQVGEASGGAFLP